VSTGEQKLLTILHVEDDDNDAILLRKACEKAKLPLDIHRVSDGDQARAYLQGSEEYQDRSKHPFPHIVVLDLKLPGNDGFEFLKWLRAQESFTALPVLIFTASGSERDRERAEAGGANAYFVKPISFDDWVKIAESFDGSPKQ
jgi:CheY-like chemotaxis protein